MVAQMNLINRKVIGRGYLIRWHLIPRNRFFNIYLHKFIGDDDERALHDHPWWSFSIRLKGELWEHKRNIDTRDLPFIHKTMRIKAKRFSLRDPLTPHRLELVDQSQPCWTIFITGPRIRDWGFDCPNGWQHWSTMTTKEGKTIGGCE